MSTNKSTSTEINFNREWFHYFQSSTDRSDERKIIETTNNLHQEERWISVDLPHYIDGPTLENSFKCWYCKQFQWVSLDERKIYVICHPLKSHANSASFRAETKIWLNNEQIFDGSLFSHSNSIELPTQLLRKNDNFDEKEGNDNCILICCINSSLCIDIYASVHGETICAMGQVILDESSLCHEQLANDILDYTVSVNDDDGRFSLNFNPRRKSKRSPLLSMNQETRNSSGVQNKSEEPDDELLIPRLVIVIMIVGTRGDVQPFIA